MVMEVDINNNECRQINAYHSVLCQVPCIWHNMRHKQVRQRVHYTCRHYVLLPKRNGLTLNDLSILRINYISQCWSYVSMFRLIRLSHIDYPNRCQRLNLQDSIWRHLLLQASPCGCSLSLLFHDFSYKLQHCLLLQRMMLLLHEELSGYHSCRQCNTHNIYRYLLYLYQIQFRWCDKILEHHNLLEVFLFLLFFFSYNPCIILLNFINYPCVKFGTTYGFAAFDFAEVPLTQIGVFVTDMGGWNSAMINPLGISPVNRTLSNILDLGWEGLSWNITLSTAPSKFRSLHLASPMLRQEADGGIGLLFLLNVRQNKNAPAIRTGMGLQRQIYVVPKPSYLFYVFATLTLNQKAPQKYNEYPNKPRNVNSELTFSSLPNTLYCGNIAKIHKQLIYNYLCINLLYVLGCLFPVLKVMGLNPIGVTSGKLVDNQYFTTFLFFIIEYIPP